MRDPVVIVPPGFDCKAAWQECSDFVQECGGLVHEDGEPNWRAAFGADPGCCGCPACDEMYWSWGWIIECSKCGFCFPTNAWAMYSWGSQAARRNCKDAEFERRLKELDERRMPHPYYRYGFEHPVEDPWKSYHELKWAEIFPGGHRELSAVH